MIFSLFGSPSLKVPTKARLVDADESEALRRKLEEERKEFLESLPPLKRRERIPAPPFTCEGTR